MSDKIIEDINALKAQVTQIEASYRVFCKEPDIENTHPALQTTSSAL